MFVAFFIAIFTPALEIAAVFVGPIAANSVFALLVSFGANYLTDTHGVKSYVVYTVAGAFLGGVFAVGAERLANSRANVYSARQ
jgi:hypothetical protein